MNFSTHAAAKFFLGPFFSTGPSFLFVCRRTHNLLTGIMSFLALPIPKDALPCNELFLRGMLHFS